MNRLNRTVVKIVGAACLLTAVSSPALARDWGYDRSGYDQRWDRDGHRGYDQLRGPGVRYLMSILRDTRRGQRFVLQHADRNGWIGERDARRANHAFQRIADRNRDGRVNRREAEWALSGRGDRDNRYSDNYRNHDRRW